jgi:hypothetical protein
MKENSHNSMYSESCATHPFVPFMGFSEQMSNINLERFVVIYSQMTLTGACYDVDA